MTTEISFSFSTAVAFSNIWWCIF